uniref:Uncharacterized protein n=1 Tax=Picea sitchensis TaxID=3332 RepID=A0A6B9XUN2_PICSI|nr:hypothetical protein Q903MT_gene6643 [Picea sitchensis]
MHGWLRDFYGLKLDNTMGRAILARSDQERVNRFEFNIGCGDQTPIYLGGEIERNEVGLVHFKLDQLLRHLLLDRTRGEGMNRSPDRRSARGYFHWGTGGKASHLDEVRSGVNRFELTIWVRVVTHHIY